MLAKSNMFPVSGHGTRANDIPALFDTFTAVDLDRVNQLAKMQSRIDNKYIVDFETFRTFIDGLKADFAVLEIGDTRQFTYRSCYYDDDFRCYAEHHQGRRQRFKARTREYVDGGGLTFFEVKLKGVRGLTAKHRIESDFVISPRIEGKYLEMLEQSYSEQYLKSTDFDLSPSLIIIYKRCTLVALKGGERVTIDYHLSFAEPHENAVPIELGDGFIIIETKSADGRGASDSALKSLRIRKASGCSKYCIGVNLIGGASKCNNFRGTLKKVLPNILPNVRADLRDPEKRTDTRKLAEGSDT